MKQSKAALFFAWRFVRNVHESALSTMLGVCFIGVGLSSFSLALVAAVMHGFEAATHEKLKGVHADITISSVDKRFNTPALSARISSLLCDDVYDLFFTGRAYCLITPPAAPPVVTLLVAIDPVAKSVQRIMADAAQISSAEPLEKLLEKRQALIGASLARQLDLSVHKPLKLFYLAEGTQEEEDLQLDHTVIVPSSTFKTGIDEYDARVIFCSHELFFDLFPEEGIRQVGIFLKPGANQTAALKKLREAFPSFSVVSWQELYPALVAALALETYAMWLILALITLVASMSVLALLFMYLTAKRREIALLMAFGMKNSFVCALFMCIGVGLCIAASLAGIVGAAIASFCIDTYQIFHLPDAYYVSHLPAHMTFSIALGVFFLVLILSVIATWLPTRRITTLSLTTLLKDEGLS